MSRSIRLMPLAASDGATNMAADEVLLEAAADRGLASLRFYTWTEPTLSLGYFQPADATHSLPTLPWIRRPTGGAAIVHHHELTYALALPARHEWLGPESWICRFHHLLRDVLAGLGLDSRTVLCGEEKELGDVLCFLHHTPGDLLINDSKVAGSAQRKRRGALLQHGSILLERSEHAQELPGINDAARRGLLTPESLVQLLTERFAAETGSTPIATDWTEEDEERREVIRSERYANPEWNNKR
jgi:lipoate-protein ligase A